MREENNNNYFWPAYVDFMIVLIFIVLGVGGYMYVKYMKKLEEIEGLKIYQKMVDEAISINEQLRKELRKSDIELDTSSKSKIKLKGDYYFEFKKTELKDSQAIKNIVALGESIKRVLSIDSNKYRFSIIIEGHTDSVGSDLFNNNLSFQRALTICEIWKTHSQLKLPDYEIIPSGFGEFKPVATNSTDSGRSLNRRIEISLIPKMEQFNKLIQEK